MPLPLGRAAADGGDAVDGGDAEDRPLDSAAKQLERCGLDWKNRKEQLFKSMHRAHKVRHTFKVLSLLFTKSALHSARWSCESCGENLNTVTQLV
jgi:hypothetical protein